MESIGCVCLTIDQNTLQASTPLPLLDGNKKWPKCFRNTFAHGYAHHIQRLMITGNFALLAGVNPSEICEWYLAVYVDAYEWVELPNTWGQCMQMAAPWQVNLSGNYIHKMSNYCQQCTYNVKTKTEPDSCPFNSLYWYFMSQHEAIFRQNPRMSMIYKTLIV